MGNVPADGLRELLLCAGPSGENLMDRAVRLFGSEPAMYGAGAEVLRFADVGLLAGERVALLRRAGVARGEPVGVVVRKVASTVGWLAGLLEGGMVAVPLNFRFPEDRWRGMAECVGVRVLVSDGGVDPAGVVREAGDVRWRCSRSGLDPERAVSVIHTSGSTGVARAAVQSFRCHCANALGALENMPFGPGDCWLLSLPLYHVGGYSLLFRSLLSGGALGVPAAGESLVSALERMPVTHLSLVPTQLFRLLREPRSVKLLRRVRAVLLGGSAVSQRLLDEAAGAGIAVFTTYGSTEMGSQIATAGEPAVAGCEPVLRPLRYREVSVSREGEVLVRGASLFSGYVVNGVLSPAVDADGWFHTGDVGALVPVPGRDEGGAESVIDDGGYGPEGSSGGGLVLSGRRDHMFVAGGENIHPEEIEAALLSLPGIGQALVVPEPDGEYGALPVAFVEVRGGAGEEACGDGGETWFAALSGSWALELRKMIGGLKVPRRFVQVERWESLPGSAKVDRGYYRRLVADRCPGSRAAGGWSADSPPLFICGGNGGPGV